MWKVTMTALCFLLLLSVRLYARPVGTFYEYVQRDSVGQKGAELVFYAPALSRYIPHIMRQYEHAKAMHTQLWRLQEPLQPPFLLLTDLQDDGNGGASPLPVNYIRIGMAPVNMS